MAFLAIYSSFNTKKVVVTMVNKKYTKDRATS